MELSLDQFRVTFEPNLVRVEQLLAAVKELGFNPTIVESNRKTAPPPPKMTPRVERALAQAQASGKLLLLKFTAHWCGPCQRMSKTTYSDATVQDELKRFFVVEVDVDKDAETARSLQIGGVPAFVVVGPGGSVLVKFQGFRTPLEFLEIIKDAE